MQYLYLQPGDSLLVRLNTVAFDESLAYSGIGEEINNFLVEMFLTNEEEEKVVNGFYKHDPEVFSRKIDSIRKLKVAVLDNLMAETPISVKALEIAKASIDYNNFSYKEKYPFHHKKRTGEKSIMDHNLHEDFYGYRKHLNFDNKDLTYFRPYYNFMKFHFGNLSYMSCATGCGNKMQGKKNHLHFNRHTLTLIDSLVKEKHLRDNLFRHVAMDYLLKVRDKEENNEVFIQEFLELSANNKHIDEIKELYDGVKRMQPNQELPDLMVLNEKNEKVSLRTIAKQHKDVVFYFWSGQRNRLFESTTKQVTLLSKQYPKHTFVGINYNTEPMRWRSMIDLKQLDVRTQFRTSNTEELVETLILDYPNKSVITKNGVIANAFADIYTSF